MNLIFLKFECLVVHLVCSKAMLMKMFHLKQCQVVMAEFCD